MRVHAAEQDELPGPRDRGARIVLGQRNLNEYRDLLLEPIAEWVGSGRLIVRLVSDLDFSWEYSSEWNEASKNNRGRYSIDEKGSLQRSEDGLPPRGFPFPDVTARMDTTTEHDPSLPYKILWNATYAESSARQILYDLDIAWVGSQSAVRRARGVLYRQWNPVAQSVSGDTDEKEQADQDSSSSSSTSLAPVASEVPAVQPLFSGVGDLWQQEVLQLRSPAVVLGYSQLLWRQRGIAPDRSWLYSPVIEKSREVPSGHRGDALLDGVITLDDFFLLGAKIQGMRAQFIGKKRILVPFPALTPFLLETAEGEASTQLAKGYHQLLDGSVTSVRWNFETRQFPTHASWLPTSMYFVPREVWLLEVWPRNAFYQTGREVIAIDTETRLPVYKLVYTHRGLLERVVLAGWALAQGKDGTTSVPFAGFVLAVDAKGRTATAVSTLQISLFSAETAPRLREMQTLLDVSAHRKQAAEGETKAAEATPKVPPKPSL